MKGIEPILHHAQEKIEQLKEAQQVRSRTLEATIETHRDSARRRAAADAEASTSSHAGQRHQGEPMQITGAQYICFVLTVCLCQCSCLAAFQKLAVLTVPPTLAP